MMSKTVLIHDNVFDVLFDIVFGVIFYVILYHVFDDFFNVVFDMVFEVKFFKYLRDCERPRFQEPAATFAMVVVIFASLVYEKNVEMENYLPAVRT